MLLDLMLALTGTEAGDAALCDQALAEAAWFPADRTLVLMNNSEEPLETRVRFPLGERAFRLEPLETRFEICD